MTAAGEREQAASMWREEGKYQDQLCKGVTATPESSTQEEAVMWGCQGEGDRIQRYQGGRGVQEAEVSEPGLQPISP